MASVGWAPEQTRRFFRAFHKYGTEFDKVARVVAGGKGAELCEALYRSHQAYLSLDKSYQSEVAFVSMVQDATRHNAQAKKEEGEDEDEQVAVVEQRQQQQQRRRDEDGLATAAPTSLFGTAALDADQDGNGGDDNDARQQEQQHTKQEEEGQGEEEEEEDEDEEEEEEEEEEAKAKQTLAAGRARRTPKRPLHFDQQQEATAAAATAAGGGGGGGGRILSPTSTGKRARAVRSASKATNAGNDMYYYDEGFGAITESARKRRASQKRLDFESGLAIGGEGSLGYHNTAGRHQQQQQQQGKRKDAAAEHHGIHALLALAAADDEAMLMGEGGEGEGEEEDGNHGERGRTGSIATLGGLQGRGLQQLYNSDFDSERDFLSDDEDEEQDAGARVEDEDDMDFETELKRKGRRTPHATPHKGKGGRPGSAHTTPRRQNQGGGVPGSGRGGGANGRALLASPGVLKSLASPHVLGRGGGGRGYGDEGMYGHHLGGGGEGMHHLLHQHLGGYGAPGSAGGGGMGRGTAAAVAAAAVARFGNRLAARAKLKKRLRRKRPIQKSIAYILPIRSLFGRRQSLNSSMGGSAAQSLLAAAAGNVGSYGEEVPAGIPMSPPEAAMRHALNARARKWAGIEFVTSAVDRPWLMAGSSMLTGLAEQVGLGGDVKLTRKEWNILRSAAYGRPRRLSRAFLNDERARLECFREAARFSYQPPGGGKSANADLKEQQGEQEEANGTEGSIVEGDTTTTATVEGDAPAPTAPIEPEKEPEEPAVTIIKPIIPAETLPKRLNVGQKVVALHPNTGQLHDGTILTAAPQWYRIQFDRRELGVEPVRDTDLMPADPWLNLSSAITADITADGDGDGKRSVVTLNGHHYVNGVLQNPPPPISKTGSVKRLDRPGSNAAAAAAMVGGTPTHMLHGAASGATPGGMGMGLGMGMGMGTGLGMGGTTPGGGVGSLGLGGGGGSGAMGTAMVINPAATPYAMAAAAAASIMQQQQQQQAAANEGPQKKLQAELAVLLDKKEALLGKLKEMNDEVETEKRKGKRVGAAAAAAAAATKTPKFVEAYAEVVLTLKGVNDEIHEKLAEFGKFGFSVVGGNNNLKATAVGPSSLGASSPDDDNKDKDEEKKEGEDGEEENEAVAKVPVPLTNPAELQSLSHLEAWAVVSSCRQKVAEDRRTEGSSDDIDAIIRPNVMDLIQSCVTTLVMLQQGSERGVSMSVLTQGLEASLKAVKPKSKENQELFGEVQTAMKQLKTLLLASDK